jgi:prepilin-type processing-associated H-X9-DG protein
MIGDGISLDQTGPFASQAESGQFSMELNDITQACVALRHMGGANILFVDGHAAHIFYSKTISRPLVMPTVTSAAIVKTWPGEWLNAGGMPTDIDTASKQEFDDPSVHGLHRNPDMPLIWSDLPKLYRY